MLDPTVLQIGYDTTFELNDFNKPRIRSKLEVIKNIVLFILFSKPGQYPSLPHIGLDIERKLYSHYTEIDESSLRIDIISQCRALGLYFDNGTVQILKIRYRGVPSLVIHIETDTNDSQIRDMMDYVNDRDQVQILIGISFDEMKRMIYHISEGRVA